MVGVYILKYTKGKVSMDDLIKKSTFIPMLSLVYEFSLDGKEHPEGIIIMPSTYEVMSLLL
jgi:hypothetical protein